MPAFGQPALGRPPAPRAQLILRLRAVDGLERLIQAAQILHRRRQLLVVGRVLVDVLRQPRGVSDLGPAHPRHVARHMDEVGDVGVEDEPAAGGAPAAARRCGSLAICASRSFTLCGRCAGSLASTLARSTSSSSGRAAVSLAADGIGALTVAYATSIRLAPMKGSRPVSISKVSTPIA